FASDRPVSVETVKTATRIYDGKLWGRLAAARSFRPPRPGSIVNHTVPRSKMWVRGSGSPCCTVANEVSKSVVPDPSAEASAKSSFAGEGENVGVSVPAPAPGPPAVKAVGPVTWMWYVTP